MRVLVTTLLLIFTSVANAESPKVVLVVGDSLSAAYGIKVEQGWVSLLENKLSQEKKKYQVINASISGDTSVSGRQRLPGLLERYRPSIVIIELGGNDGLRGLPTAVMKQNLEQMILAATKSGAKVVLAGIRIPPNYGKRYTENFYDVYTSLSRKHELVLIPFLLEGIADRPELMQDDGIHPRQAAQPLILQHVWQSLHTLL